MVIAGLIRFEHLATWHSILQLVLDIDSMWRCLSNVDVLVQVNLEVVVVDEHLNIGGFVHVALRPVYLW